MRLGKFVQEIGEVFIGGTEMEVEMNLDGFVRWDGDGMDFAGYGVVEYGGLQVMGAGLQEMGSWDEKEGWMEGWFAENGAWDEEEVEV